MDTKEYYISQYNVGIPTPRWNYNYRTLKNVICTSNTPNNNVLWDIITLNTEIQSTWYSSKALENILWWYENMRVLNSFSRNESDMYDFFLPVKINNNYFFYKKSKQ
jgi:hypothetical protein